MMSSLLNKKALTSGLTTLALAALCSTGAQAQIAVTASTLTYTQNFNTLDTANANSSNLPAGWQLFEFGTSTTTVNQQYKGGNGASNTGDAYSFGTAGSTDRALGSLASGSNRQMYGARFVNNTGATITSFTLNYRGEQWRNGHAPNGDTLQFRYSTTATAISDTASANWTVNNGLTLTSIITDTTSGAKDGNASGNYTTKTGTVTLTVPVGGIVSIEWVDLNVTGNDDGLSIDDLSITFATGTPPVVTNIYLTGKTPTGNNVPLTTNTLTASFDHAIDTASGTVTLYKAGNPTPVTTFNVPSAQVTFSDSTATMTGLSLENNTDYYVNMTAGVFTDAGDTLPNLAITDATTWMFSTEDTTTTPPPPPMTSLNESFSGCINTAMGVFVQYSTSGAKTWRCSIYGHGDSSSVYINGGSATGVSETNSDWLISKAPFDFSAMATPKMSLWQNSRFDGTVTRAVKISTNYVAGADPATANWTTLNVAGMNTQPSPGSGVWTQITGIDLTAYKSTPFYLAFTYECGSTGAYELTYDDIKVENGTVGIFTPSRGQLQLQVLGDATAANINLGIALEKAAELNVQIFDLTGRNVHTEVLKANSGKGVYTINNTSLRSGMYVIRISNGTDYGTVKAMVH